jgi:hypothetical protein
VQKNLNLTIIVLTFLFVKKIDTFSAYFLGGLFILTLQVWLNEVKKRTFEFKINKKINYGLADKIVDLKKKCELKDFLIKEQKKDIKELLNLFELEETNGSN